MRRAAVAAALAVLVGACTQTAPPRARPTPTPSPTPSPTPPAPFRLVVVGDQGSRDEAAAAVARAIEADVARDGADALITTGDNVYPRAAPKYFERAWTRPYGWTRAKGLRVIASLGNHDVAGNERAVMELLGMPERFYAVTIASADIFVLDANRPDEAEQSAWLDRSLQASNARWKIVVFHQPAFSCSTHGNNRGVIDHWLPILEANQVDLVLNGHDHNYQRFVRAGVTYVVTGGGGRHLYPFARCAPDTPQRIAGSVTYHYLRIEGTDASLNVRAISVNGVTLDDVTLT